MTSDWLAAQPPSNQKRCWKPQLSDIDLDIDLFSYFNLHIYILITGTWNSHMRRVHLLRSSYSKLPAKQHQADSGQGPLYLQLCIEM